jgi:Sigma-70, region 4
MATYTVSAPPRPNRLARYCPGPAILPCVHLTALGSPLVPEVKTSMSRSPAVAGAPSNGACAARLSPSSGSTGTSIQTALTLRAVGGLTTAEIARAFLVPEATMAARISRASLAERRYLESRASRVRPRAKETVSS